MSNCKLHIKQNTIVLKRDILHRKTTTAIKTSQLTRFCIVDNCLFAYFSSNGTSEGTNEQKNTKNLVVKCTTFFTDVGIWVEEQVKI